VGVAHSMLILSADYRFADYGRKAAAQWVAPRVSSGETVWYSGQWSFYWYAERAGAKLARPDLRLPVPGDLVVVSVYEGGTPILDYIPNRYLSDTLIFECNCGRTMSNGAGLYSNIWGNLLWTWASGESGKYELWRVF